MFGWQILFPPTCSKKKRGAGTFRSRVDSKNSVYARKKEKKMGGGGARVGGLGGKVNDEYCCRIDLPPPSLVLPAGQL